MERSVLPRFVPSEGGRQRTGDVLYYPGEMVLGWLALYDRHPSPELMEWSVKALMHLARQRASEGKAPPDHWALIATAELFRLAQRDHVQSAGSLAEPRDADLPQAPRKVTTRQHGRQWKARSSPGAMSFRRLRALRGCWRR